MIGVARARAGTLRLLATLIGGAALLWVSLGVTYTLVAGENNPKGALALWPGAIPRVAIAARQVGTDAGAASLAAASSSAAKALRSEPANVQAARTLSLINAQRGRLGVANRMIDYAQTLSRRDLATELYLIERFVQSGDVGGALRHYDHALRTSRKSADLLMPVLVQAIGDSSIRRQLGELLRMNPPWRYEFFGRVLIDAGDVEALRDLMTRAALRSAEPGGATFTRQLVGRLLAAKAYDEAFAAYRAATGQASAPLLRDGEFETRNLVPPFDWWFSDDPLLYAVPENVSGADGAFALRIIAKDAKAGPVAKQLLLLSPNRYRLSGRMGGLEGEAGTLMAQVACVDDDRVLGKATLPVRDAGRFQVDIGFDASCPAQWLSFATSGPEVGETAFWIDSVMLQKIR